MLFTLVATVTADGREVPADVPTPATGLFLGLVFSPDGQTAWWGGWEGQWGKGATGNQLIFRSDRVDDQWTEARTASFSGRHNDSDPYPSPDGRWLYFVSDRPVGPSTQIAGANIWRVATATGSEPELLSINSAGDEYSPVVTDSGALYFASTRPGGLGQGDLYRAAPAGAVFKEPVGLGEALNSPHGEWNLWVSSDESEMLFEASGRPQNLSIPGDLYYSLQIGGAWTPALPVAELNSTGSDLMPRLHPDGERLYYSRATRAQGTSWLVVDWRELRASLRAAAETGAAATGRTITPGATTSEAAPPQ